MAVASAAVGLVAGIDVAQAATLEFCVNHPYAETEVNFSTDLPKFDPSLGTFQSATITAAAGAQTSIGLMSSAQTPAAVIAKGTSTTSLSTTGPDGVEAALALDLVATTGFVSIDPGSTFNYGPVEVLANASRVSTDVARWAGAGTVHFSTTSLSGLSVAGGGGNLASTQATSATFKMCVVYDYELAPTTTTAVPTTTAAATTTMAPATTRPATTTTDVGANPPGPTTTGPTPPAGVGLPATGGGNGGLVLGALLVAGGAALLAVRRRGLPSRI